MTKSVYISAINHISVLQDLGEGIELIAKSSSRIYPVVKLTNNRSVIEKLLSPELEKLIGLIEYRYLSTPGILVAYSESGFDESVANSLQHLDLHLILLKMYFYCLWVVKDNSIDFDLSFLCFRNKYNDFEVSSNVFSSSSFTSLGERAMVEFSVGELKEACALLKNNITIEENKSKTGNASQYSRVAIACYFIQHARSSADLGLKMTSYCSALETLFSNDSTELSHKLAERVAHFLSKDKGERIALFRMIKKAYEVRSKVVHGSTFKDGKIKEIESLIVEVDSVCRKISLFTLNTPEVNNPFEWTNERHEEYFLDIIMA